MSTVQVLQLYQFVYDGIDGQAAGTVYLQFSCDIPSVCDDGMGGEIQPVCNLPVCHAFHHADDNLFFPAAQCLLVIAFPFFGRHFLGVEAFQLVLQLVRTVVYGYLVVVGAKQERVAHII